MTETTSSNIADTRPTLERTQPSRVPEPTVDTQPIQARTRPSKTVGSTVSLLKQFFRKIITHGRTVPSNGQYGGELAHTGPTQQNTRARENNQTKASEVLRRQAELEELERRAESDEIKKKWEQYAKGLVTIPEDDDQPIHENYSGIATMKDLRFTNEDNELYDFVHGGYEAREELRKAWSKSDSKIVGKALSLMRKKVGDSHFEKEGVSENTLVAEKIFLVCTSITTDVIKEQKRYSRHTVGKILSDDWVGDRQVLLGGQGYAEQFNEKMKDFFTAMSIFKTFEAAHALSKVPQPVVERILKTSRAISRVPLSGREGESSIVNAIRFFIIDGCMNVSAKGVDENRAALRAFWK